MFHSSPLKGVEFQTAWGHASYRAPIERPELTEEYVQEASLEEIQQSMYYEQRFRSSPGLESLSTHNEYEDNECRERDLNQCQISKWAKEATEPYIFCFIPPGWNNTVDKNNSTGNLLSSGRILTDVDLLDDIISPYKLGKTHKVWDMICVHADLFQALSCGWCVLKYENTEQHEDGDVNVFNVVCRFYWMPQLTPRFNKTTDGTAEVYALLEELNLFFEGKCPPPPIYPSKSPASLQQVSSTWLRHCCQAEEGKSRCAKDHICHQGTLGLYPLCSFLWWCWARSIPDWHGSERWIFEAQG